MKKPMLQIVNKYFGNFKSVEHVRKRVYKLTNENNIPMRLDVSYSLTIIKVQKVLLQHNIEVPKLIAYEKINKSIWKISEWIDGVRVKDIPSFYEVFYKLGDLMGRMCLVPYEGGFVTNGEASSPNIIWRRDRKLYIVDLGRTSVKEDVSFSLIKLCLKRFGSRERIDAFLDGFSKHIDPTKLVRELKKREWKWLGKTVSYTKQMIMEYDDSLIDWRKST